MKAQIPLLLSLILMLFACSHTPHEPSPSTVAIDKGETEAAIRDLAGQYEGLFTNGETAALANLFTEDGISMPPNAPALTGRAAIQSNFQSQFQQVTGAAKISTEEVVVAGDWGVARGSYSLTLTPKAGGKPIDDAGKWVNRVKRQPDGSWKIAWLIWNSDHPLPGARQ